jgi:hypothetical protein
MMLTGWGSADVPIPVKGLIATLSITAIDEIGSAMTAL